MFRDMIGNSQVKARLRTLAVRGRIPNSLLFAGPEGVGKRLFALGLSKMLLCKGANGDEGCGTCSTCSRIGNIQIPEPSDRTRDEFRSVFFSEHPDVGMLAPYKQAVLVDAIRSLEREAFFMPYEGRSRVFVIDNADRMNDAASNALLKTLEEPARTSYIILVTSRPDALLQTIRSRCQTVRFAPVDAAEVERYLVDTRSFSSEDARLGARLSAGSISRASKLDLGDHRRRRQEMLGLLENAVLRGDLAEMLRFGERMNDAKNRDGFEGSIEIFEDLVRELWLLRNGSGVETVANFDIIERLSDLAAGADAAVFAVWLEAIEELRRNFAVNVNRKLATDALFVKMAAAGA